MKKRGQAQDICTVLYIVDSTVSLGDGVFVLFGLVAGLLLFPKALHDKVFVTLSLVTNGADVN